MLRRGNSVPGGLTQLRLGLGLGPGALGVGLDCHFWPLSLVGLFTCPTRLPYDNGLLSAFVQLLAARGLHR